MSMEGDQVAVVTGASGRVAQAVIERLRTDGFRVAGLDDRGARADLPIAVDLTDLGATTAAVERVSSELGPISVLVTAPWMHEAAPFGEMELDRWRRLLDAHLGGTANACRAVIPGMVAAGGGTVVTLSSWLAIAGIPGEAYMAAATGTLFAFTKSLALEVIRDGVHVNGIAVGPEEAEPPAIGVRPEEVADTVSFLVADGQHFVGQILNAAAGAVV